MLAIAKKSYVFQSILGENFEKAVRCIKHGIQAFEFSKKNKSIQKLVQAYEALPNSEKSISICADIVESLLQLKAYQHAIHIAEHIEYTVAMKTTETKTDHFNIMRVYSNLAEAHSEAHQQGMARRYYHKALDHIFESTQEPDLEIVNLLLNRLEHQV